MLRYGAGVTVWQNEVVKHTRRSHIPTFVYFDLLNSFWTSFSQIALCLAKIELKLRNNGVFGIFQRLDQHSPCTAKALWGSKTLLRTFIRDIQVHSRLFSRHYIGDIQVFTWISPMKGLRSVFDLQRALVVHVVPGHISKICLKHNFFEVWALQNWKPSWPNDPLKRIQQVKINKDWYVRSSGLFDPFILSHCVIGGSLIKNAMRTWMFILMFFYKKALFTLSQFFGKDHLKINIRTSKNWTKFS